MFYALLNGWYLGQWADYSSCLQDATESQYVLATVKGTYNGNYKFTRGGVGKYTDGYTTKMGLCFPKVCTEDEVRYFTEELILGYAKGAGWENPTVDYHMASTDDGDSASEVRTGAVAVGAILLIALGLCGAGIITELTKCGDKPDYKDEHEAQALYEAAKFRRMAQYDAVLLQRKSDRSSLLLPFSLIRNGVQLNILPRGQRTVMKKEQSDPAIAQDKRIT